MRQAAQGVRLVHKLRELRGAEELLDRRRHRLRIYHALRRYGVHVLCRHPLAHDPLHTVHPDPERLLHELSYGPQTPVAEVLVLVELMPHTLVVDPAELLFLGEPLGYLDEPLEQSLDILDSEGVGIFGYLEL